MNDGLRAVRRAEAGEAREVARVWLRSRLAAFPSIPGPVHDDDEVRAWLEMVVLPKADIWVLDGKSGIVGLLVLDGGGSTSCMSTLHGVAVVSVRRSSSSRRLLGPMASISGRSRRRKELDGSTRDTGSSRLVRRTGTT
jgi:hypothetical protein